MADGRPPQGVFWERVNPAALLPRPAGGDDARLTDLLAALDPLAPRALKRATVRDLLNGIIAGSPFLSGLLSRDAARAARLLHCVPEHHIRDRAVATAAVCAQATTMADLMAALRHYKTEVALLTALCDLAGVWTLTEVTQALTEAADLAVRSALSWLFRHAVARGDWTDTDPEPESRCGYFVLGMGKYGAFELNYSSDIDLIVFYDASRVRLRAGLEAQAFFVRLTRDLVKILQERTGDGYVFRTDLRLRPDAGATQIALSVDAALHYYESVGQNWERAAMIKARCVAGDGEAGRAFLAGLAPFIWRKYLDFAAIADIHAMKRQIHAHRGFAVVAVAGHNIKLGRGGIREIEFFAQTQQLIAGGRQMDLRTPRTLDALNTLVARGWIKPEVRDDLARAYDSLRSLEHRLQMVADEQTHELPTAGDDLARFARFAGFEDSSALSETLVDILRVVERHYAALFEDMPELTATAANMVFAGEEDDPGTVEALARMGYSQPSQILATVRGWHHGRYPAVRSARSRERLTEVQPLLVKALAETADADAAFARFDRFLSELPGGVQLFSLLRANVALLRLVADIMGSAPRLARILSRRPRVLDGVLDPRVLEMLAGPQELARLLSDELGPARDYQETLDRARAVGQEQAFLIGVRILSGMISAGQAGHAYATLAEQLIAALQRVVEQDFARSHGTLPGAAACVLAMGKLGGREMTAGSDLDLILVYDFDPERPQSGGLKPLPASVYYARFTQRLISALSAPTAEGQLYDVDLRLRPSGQKGPVATQLSSFVEYQRSEAWTWEHMALTRARVLTGPADAAARVAEAVRASLIVPRDRGRVATDVRDMRARIAAEKGTERIWDLKQVRGGLIDIEFMAQHLQLVHAARHPGVLDQNTARALQKLAAEGLLAAEHAAVLIPAARLLAELTQITRLCVDGPFDPATAPDGLKNLLARVGEVPTFAHLEADLAARLSAVAALFDEVIV